MSLQTLAAKRALMDHIVARYTAQEHVGSPEAWLDLCHMCLQIGSYTSIRTASVSIEEKSNSTAQAARTLCAYLLRDVRETLRQLRHNGVGAWQETLH